MINNNYNNKEEGEEEGELMRNTRRRKRRRTNINKHMATGENDYYYSIDSKKIGDFIDNMINDIVMNDRKLVKNNILKYIYNKR